MIGPSTSSRIARRPRAPVWRSTARSAIASSASVVELELDAVELEHALVLPTSAFFGSVRISMSASWSSGVTVATTGRRPMNSGMSPNLCRSSGQHLAEQARASSPLLCSGAPKPMPRLPTRGGDDVLEPGERAGHDEQHVRRVDLDELLVRMLAAALRRNRGDRALEDLQQRLLHALARDVARDRRVLGLAGDLVDLVDVDDAGLGALRRRSRRPG